MSEPSKRILYIVSLNHAVNDGSVYVLSSLFPFVLSIFTLTVFQVGILVALGYLVSVICQPIVGRYSEGRDSGKLLAVGISIITISILTFVLANGFVSLLLSVILLRVGSSFFHPVGISAVSRTYSGPRLQKAMGFQSSFGNFGVLLVYLTAAPLYVLLGWKTTFLVFAAYTLGDVLITRYTLRNNPVPPSPVVKSRSGSSRRVGLPIPIFFVAAAFISGGSYAVILNFANILLSSRSQLGVSESDLVVSAFIGAAFLGALSTGIWKRFLETRENLALSYLLASISLLTFTVLSGNIAIAIISLLAVGFMISATYPLTYTETSNHLTTEAGDVGRSFGVLSSAQTVGASALGIISGYVSQQFSLDVSFLTVSGLMFLGFLLSVYWIRQHAAAHLQTEPVRSIQAEAKAEPGN